MNLSQQKRERLLNFIKELKSSNSFDEKSLIELNEIENELNGKKYGLVWEEHEEAVDVQMKEAVPVFAEDKAKEILCDKDAPYNFLLEGDNLHSLYLLEKTHKGKIDVIYIDPPYNTGTTTKDLTFVYDDRKIDKNDSYRHSCWLSFMHSRLSLAMSLLSKEGVLIISIDDNELYDLKILCDEIFGSSNFIACVPTIMNLKGNQDQFGFAGTHEYTLFYAKNIKEATIGSFDINDEDIESEWEIDDIGFFKKGATLKRTGNDAPREKRPFCFYPILIDKNDNVSSITEVEYKKIYNKETKEFDDNYLKELKQEYEQKGFLFVLPTIDEKYASWRWGYKTLIEDANEVIVTSEKTLYKKQRPEISDLPTSKPKSVFYSPLYSTTNGTSALKSIFGDKVFNNPKPPALIKDFIKISSDSKSIVLDFFAGSGTTGQAVLELNKDDGGNRKFILCTNNENNICEEITYQRLKTVITGKRADGSKYSDGLPANLKYFKTDFVSKSSKNLSKELTKHVKELIELEWGVSIDKKVNLMVMTEEELDKIEANWDKLKTTVKSIYRARQVVYTGKQKQLFKNINNFIIPDYYFNNELKEVGENW